MKNSSTKDETTTSSLPIGNTDVVRRIYEEMITERNFVNSGNRYTTNYREGYTEAVRCLAVVIKQLTGEDVR